METSGRERRHRYYTVKNYQKLVSQEALDKESAGYHDTGHASCGGFYQLPADMFYRDEGELRMYQDSFKGDELSQPPKKATKRAPKNPILPDGTVKRGRPRKHPPKAEDPRPSSQSSKRKREGADPIPDPRRTGDFSPSAPEPSTEGVPST